MNSTPSNNTASIDSRLSGANHESNRRSDPDRSALLDDLLLATSRTFGLAIPLLPGELRNQVTVAYLLFRLADTIEDGQFTTADEKLAKFDGFANLFDEDCAAKNVSSTELESVKNRFGGLNIDNDDYLRLVAHLDDVIAATDDFAPNIREIILPSLNGSIQGMRKFVAAGDNSGNVQLQSLEEVRDYCYAVAGIVGEMLTELFLEHATQLQPVATELRQRARAFGEGLQLVNILKDSTDDLAAGRRFIPDDMPRMQLFEIARHDLKLATEYIRFLIDSAAPDTLIAFCDLPVRLAWRTLDCVEAHGPGSKIPREEVGQIVSEVMANGRNSNTESQSTTRNRHE